MAPVLIAVTVLESPESGSVSFVNMSFAELFVALKVVSFAILIVLVSFTATGASLAPVTTINNSAVSVPPLPSETV